MKYEGLDYGSRFKYDHRAYTFASGSKGYVKTEFRMVFKQSSSIGITDYCLLVEGSDFGNALPLYLDSIIIPFEMENDATSVAVAGRSGESGQP